MTRIALQLAAALALSLSACMAAPPPRTGGPLPPSTMQCNADGARWAIGQAVTPEVVERVRVDTRSSIAWVIRPGQPVDADFSAERVNISVNERNAIVGIVCG